MYLCGWLMGLKGGGLRVQADGYGQLQRARVFVTVIIQHVSAWRRGEQRVQLFEQNALVLVFVYCHHLKLDKSCYFKFLFLFFHIP